MTERPILFSGPMVRALLDDSKTQTRRVVKPQFAADAIPVEMPATDPAGGWVVPGHSGVWWCDAAANPDDVRRCPYGQPGDRLWVRETHAPRVDCLGAWDRSMQEGFNRMGAEDICYSATTTPRDWVGKWRPSIHMPRWASRITLEVTGVRVERLQDISDSDALAEGVDEWRRGACSSENPYGYSPADYFRLLWSQINGPDSWGADPWVWVVEFRRLP